MRAKTLLLAASLGAVFALAAASGPEFKDMTPGHYAVTVNGMLTQTCARAIARELGALPEVSEAAADFDAEEATLTVRDGSLLRIPHLRRALRRAARLANLGSDFELRAIRYLP